MQYIHKPTEVEAIQLTPETIDQCVEFIGEAVVSKGATDCSIFIRTEEGDRMIRENDYIIKGVLGKIYPCSPEVFEESYSAKE